MDEDVTILAKTIFGEARGEGLSGMEAVANVIMNRVKHAQKMGQYWWGNSVKDVCLKPFQFSCWNNNDPNKKVLEQDLKQNLIYGICERIAVRAIKGLLKDNTNGATHYHTKKTHPKWAHTAVPCAEIGGHIFYAHV